jgi:hypothetical protein
MPETRPDRTELGRIHERIDTLVGVTKTMGESVAVIAATCGPCQKRLADIEQTLDGNGQAGLKQRVGVLESGRTDTLSIRSVQVLLGAIGAFILATLGAVAGLLWKSPPSVGP